MMLRALSGVSLYHGVEQNHRHTTATVEITHHSAQSLPIMSIGADEYSSHRNVEYTLHRAHELTVLLTEFWAVSADEMGTSNPNRRGAIRDRFACKLLMGFEWGSIQLTCRMDGRTGGTVVTREGIKFHHCNIGLVCLPATRIIYNQWKDWFNSYRQEWFNDHQQK